MQVENIIGNAIADFFQFGTGYATHEKVVLKYYQELQQVQKQLKQEQQAKQEALKAKQDPPETIILPYGGQVLFALWGTMVALAIAAFAITFGVVSSLLVQYVWVAVTLTIIGIAVLTALIYCLIMNSIALTTRTITLHSLAQAQQAKLQAAAAVAAEKQEQVEEQVPARAAPIL